MNKQLHFTPQAEDAEDAAKGDSQRNQDQKGGGRMNPKNDIADAGKARANAFMARFADYEKSPAYKRRKKALDDRQAKSLAKDLSGKRKGGIEELRTIPGFVESESEIRKENSLHLAMMEAKKRSGLNQLEIAERLGMPQPNVSRIEHSPMVTFSTFSAYLFACGFDFKIDLRPIASSKTLFSRRPALAH